MFHILTVEAGEAFIAARDRATADRERNPSVCTSPLHLLFGLLQNRDNAAVALLTMAGVSAQAVLFGVEACLKCKKYKRYKTGEALSDDFVRFMFAAVKKTVNATSLDSVDLLFLLMEDGDRETKALLKKHGTTVAKLKTYTDRIKREKAEKVGLSPQMKEEGLRDAERYKAANEDPKKFGFNSWDEMASMFQ